MGLVGMFVGEEHRVEMIDLGVDQLLIGLHGASEAAYRAFHPSFTAADWQRLHAMLGRFRDAGRGFKHVHVICAVNADEPAAMVRQAAAYGAEQVNFKLASLRGGTAAGAIDLPFTPIWTSRACGFHGHDAISVCTAKGSSPRGSAYA